MIIKLIISLKKSARSILKKEMIDLFILIDLLIFYKYIYINAQRLLFKLPNFKQNYNKITVFLS
jgi:hypothetical protein